jgi:hypothetical protein
VSSEDSGVGRRAELDDDLQWSTAAALSRLGTGAPDALICLAVFPFVATTRAGG